MAESSLVELSSRILDGSPVPAFVINARHSTTHWNDALARMSGMAAKEVLGTHDHWRAFYPYGTRRVVQAEMIVRRTAPEDLADYYGGRARPSVLVACAFEAVDFFPAFGASGAWLRFMAAPLRNLRGDVIGAVETLVDLGANDPSR